MNIKRAAATVLTILILLGLTTGITFFTLKFIADKNQQASASSAVNAVDWSRQIGLDADQQKKLAPYEAEMKKDLDKIQLKLAEQRISLCQLMQREPADSQKVNQYIQQVSALEAEQQKRVVRHLFVMRDLLRPDQKEKMFSSLMQAICAGCASMTPDKKQQCLCGMDNMKGHTK